MIHVRAWRLERPALYFFFQAEDGIRDYKVTGVQTCALPISEVRELERHAEVVLAHRLDRGLEVVALLAGHAELVALHLVGDALEPEALHELRSEERRVGKECRSRWSPYH